MKNEDSLKEEERSPKRSYFKEVLTISILAALGIIFFTNLFYVVIPAGHKGVHFSAWGGGTQLNKSYDEGLKLKSPWDRIILYNTRIQEYQDTIRVLTKDGLEVMAEVSFRYFPISEKLGELHKNLGPKYLNTILVPRIISNTRDVISKFQVNELYSTSQDSIQKTITRLSQEQISKNYPMKIVDVVIRRIVLPTKVIEAINGKLVYEQEALHRKIEAQGIRTFTDTSQLDILKWEGIQATKDLAKSQNTKVIVIGTDSGDLPIILGGNN